MGLLSGRRPKNLGVHDGQLKPAPSSPNCVNSQSAKGYSKIAPIAYTGDGKVALARINALVAATPGAKIVESKANYLYAEFTTKLLGFVDDVEFFVDEMASVIHVRSASRLGHKDFGVNRKRIESIREAFGSAR